MVYYMDLSPTASLEVFEDVEQQMEAVTILLLLFRPYTVKV